MEIAYTTAYTFTYKIAKPPRPHWYLVRSGIWYLARSGTWHDGMVLVPGTIWYLVPGTIRSGTWHDQIITRLINQLID